MSSSAVYFSPHNITLAGFTVLMGIAAFEDLRRLVIPNLLPLALCLLWPFYFAADPSLYGALAAIGCALAVFLVGAVLFARGYIGGGDVKLLSAAALWAGPAGTPGLLLLTGLLGGALAVLLMTPGIAPLAEVVRLKLGPTRADPVVTPVPYGIAIAAAALIVMLSPSLS